MGHLSVRLFLMFSLQKGRLGQKHFKSTSMWKGRAAFNLGLAPHSGSVFSIGLRDSGFH